MIVRAELKSKAKSQLKEKLWLCIGTVFVFSLLINIFNLSANIELSDSVTIVLNILGFLLSGVLTVGLSKFLLNVIKNENPKFTDLFSGFKIYLKTLGLMLLIGVLILAGTLFFVIPGIIIGLGVSMAPYILAEDNSKGVIQSLKESWRLMKGHKWEYFVLQISFFLWYMLGAITLGIAFLWILPYINLTDANYYLELKNGSKEEIIIE